MSIVLEVVDDGAPAGIEFHTATFRKLADSVTHLTINSNENVATVAGELQYVVERNRIQVVDRGRHEDDIVIQVVTELLQ